MISYGKAVVILVIAIIVVAMASSSHSSDPSNRPGIHIDNPTDCFWMGATHAAHC